MHLSPEGVKNTGQDKTIGMQTAHSSPRQSCPSLSPTESSPPQPLLIIIVTHWNKNRGHICTDSHRGKEERRGEAGEEGEEKEQYRRCLRENGREERREWSQKR
ncbi:hypothetical protein E2C01_070584 [Portunus trituberculatus]|uniref:Uncharacterized protein n=1 Tax=Portunus trituberculatus TaxID=210409 RepID=A0A5B7I5N5_PORTR|nr:hypothetical protein [Portunus trituberculatus]